MTAKLPNVGEPVQEAPHAPRGRKPWPPRTVTPEDMQIAMQLQEFLAQATAGQIKGLILAVHYGGQEFAYAGSGTFCKEPKLVGNAIDFFKSKFLAPFTPAVHNMEKKQKA